MGNLHEQYRKAYIFHMMFRNFAKLASFVTSEAGNSSDSSEAPSGTSDSDDSSHVCLLTHLCNECPRLLVAPTLCHLRKKRCRESTSLCDNCDYVWLLVTTGPTKTFNARYHQLWTLLVFDMTLFFSQNSHTMILTFETVHSLHLAGESSTHMCEVNFTVEMGLHCTARVYTFHIPQRTSIASASNRLVLLRRHLLSDILIGRHRLCHCAVTRHHGSVSKRTSICGRDIASPTRLKMKGYWDYTRANQNVPKRNEEILRMSVLP
jgi:hypothetical protein